MNPTSLHLINCEPENITSLLAENNGSEICIVSPWSIAGLEVKAIIHRIWMDWLFQQPSPARASIDLYLIGPKGLSVEELL